MQRFSQAELNFSICLFSLLIIVVNLRFLQSPIIGTLFFVLYSLGISRRISLKLHFFDKYLTLPFGFLLLNMLFVAMTAVVIRLSIPLTDTLLSILISVPMLFFLYPKKHSDTAQENPIEKSDTTQKNSGKKISSYLILVLFSVALIGMLYVSWSTRTEVTIINAAVGLPPSYHVFHYVACALLGIIIISKHDLETKLISLSAFSIISCSFRYVRYAILPGSDNWTILAKTWYIHDGGTIIKFFTQYPFGRALYYSFATSDNGYLGFWGLNAFQSRITGISQYLTNGIFVAILSALFVPLILYQIGKILLKNQTYALFLSFLFVFLLQSYIWLTIPSPNTLGLLALLFSLLFWICYLEYDEMPVFLLIIASLSGVLAYPLTGLFAAGIAVTSIAIKKLKLNKKTFILAILFCLIIPLYDIGMRISQFLLSGELSLPNLRPISDLLSKLLFVSQRTGYNQLFDIPYFIVALLALIGILWSRKKIGTRSYWLLLITFTAAYTGEIYGWLMQIRIITRIGETILPWFWLIFAGIGLFLFIPKHLKLIPSVQIKLKNKAISAKKIVLVSGILLLALFPTSYRILLPTTNSQNPSVGMVNAANYIILKEPSKNALVLGDSYSLDIVAALSHGSWYDYPYGSCLTALERTQPFFYQLVRGPPQTSVIVNARDDLAHFFYEEFNRTIKIGKCYLIYDEDEAKVEQWWYSPWEVEELNDLFGPPTIFGSTRVYYIDIDKYLFQSKVADISGNNNDGIANGILCEGVKGKAIEFINQNVFILLPSLPLNDTFTFETWVNYHDGLPSGDYAGLFYLKGENTWMTVLLQNNTIRSSILSKEGQYQQCFANLTFDLRDSWHHIAIEYDGKRLFYFLDGVLVYNESQTTIIQGKLDEIVVGWGTPQKSNWYHLEGAIDELRVYARALNASEISYSYENKIPQNMEKLLLWYSFDIPK